MYVFSATSITILFALWVTLCLSTDEYSQLENQEYISMTIHTSVNSASLQWKVRPSPNCCNGNNSIKLNCTGTNLFQDTEGRSRLNRVNVIQFFPGASTQGMLSRLKPNMHFNCDMAFFYKKDCIFSNGFEFSTPITAPEPPPRPIIEHSPTMDNLYTIELHNTTTRNGPISGYEIQFLPVDESPLDEHGVPVFMPGVLKPFSPNIPLAEVAESSTVPIGFCYRYNMDQPKGRYHLPRFIMVDDDNLLNNALQKGSSYVVVTIAYTYTDRGILYANSEPSPVFTMQSIQPSAVTKEIVAHKVTKLKPSSIKDEGFGRRFGRKIHYIGLSAIPLLLLVCGVVVSYVYRKATNDYNSQKRKDYYHKRMKKSHRYDPQWFFSSRHEMGTGNKTWKFDNLYMPSMWPAHHTKLPEDTKNGSYAMYPNTAFATSMYNESYGDGTSHINDELYQTSNVQHDIVYMDQQKYQQPIFVKEHYHQSIRDSDLAHGTVYNGNQTSVPGNETAVIGNETDVIGNYVIRNLTPDPESAAVPHDMYTNVTKTQTTKAEITANNHSAHPVALYTVQDDHHHQLTINMASLQYKEGQQHLCKEFESGYSSWQQATTIDSNSNISSTSTQISHQLGVVTEGKDHAHYTTHNDSQAVQMVSDDSAVELKRRSGLLAIDKLYNVPRDDPVFEQIRRMTEQCDELNTALHDGATDEPNHWYNRPSTQTTGSSSNNSISDSRISSTTQEQQQQQYYYNKGSTEYTVKPDKASGIGPRQDDHHCIDIPPLNISRVISSYISSSDSSTESIPTETSEDRVEYSSTTIGSSDQCTEEHREDSYTEGQYHIRNGNWNEDRLQEPSYEYTRTNAINYNSAVDNRKHSDLYQSITVTSDSTPSSIQRPVKDTQWQSHNDEHGIGEDVALEIDSSDDEEIVFYDATCKQCHAHSKPGDDDSVQSSHEWVPENTVNQEWDSSSIAAVSGPSGDACTGCDTDDSDCCELRARHTRDQWNDIFCTGNSDGCYNNRFSNVRHLSLQHGNTSAIEPCTDKYGDIEEDQDGVSAYSTEDDDSEIVFYDATCKTSCHSCKGNQPNTEIMNTMADLMSRYETEAADRECDLPVSDSCDSEWTDDPLSEQYLTLIKEQCEILESNARGDHCNRCNDYNLESVTDSCSSEYSMECHKDSQEYMGTTPDQDWVGPGDGYSSDYEQLENDANQLAEHQQLTRTREHYNQVSSTHRHSREPHDNSESPIECSDTISRQTSSTTSNSSTKYILSKEDGWVLRYAKTSSTNSMVIKTVVESSSDEEYYSSNEHQNDEDVRSLENRYTTSIHCDHQQNSRSDQRQFSGNKRLEFEQQQTCSVVTHGLISNSSTDSDSNTSSQIITSNHPHSEIRAVDMGRDPVLLTDERQGDYPVNIEGGCLSDCEPDNKHSVDNFLLADSDLDIEYQPHNLLFDLKYQQELQNNQLTSQELANYNSSDYTQEQAVPIIPEPDVVEITGPPEEADVYLIVCDSSSCTAVEMVPSPVKQEALTTDVVPLETAIEDYHYKIRSEQEAALSSNNSSSYFFKEYNDCGPSLDVNVEELLLCRRSSNNKSNHDKNRTLN